MRFKAAFHYQLKSDVQALLWFYVWGIAGIVVIPLLMWLLFDRSSAYNLNATLPNALTAIVLTIFLIAYGGNTFDGFKVLIQNGIGRKTYFWSKAAVMATIIIAGEVVNALYGLFYVAVVDSHGTVLAFQGFYGKATASPIVSGLITFLITVLFMFCLTMTAMFAGSVLALFSRRTQLILLVGIPILLFIMMFAAAAIDLPRIWQFTWLSTLAEWVYGYHPNVQAGTFNAGAPLISGLIYLGVMTGATYAVNLKLKYPR
ncbi:hypothetical protein [Secundilactobacillus kimchicus]|uniref:hypothetical protein n=1 Tax=Secundilactobacillus kimchicus TaxID=528209 RepID=UPI0024A9C2D7|nr:hypothetical protein [Secundilactobacillus kimchicus]